jgi:hypothetical protein
MIKNIYLRILLLPFVFLIWLVQFCVFGFMGIIGCFFGLMSLFSCLIFGDEFDKEVIFVLCIGWWAYYPWIWWYRYFTTGRFYMIEEFN